MPRSLLQRQIKQRRPFRLEEEAVLNAQRTAAALQRPAEALMKAHGLSESSYNVLRILRGSHPEGLPCHEISSRMIVRVPDVTRLTDRLIKMGLVERERSTEDRRVVLIRATQAGLDLVDALDEPLDELVQSQLRHMSKQELETLVALLEKARSPAEDGSQA